MRFHNVAVSRFNGVFLQENVWVFRWDEKKWPSGGVPLYCIFIVHFDVITETLEMDIS